MKTLKAYGSLAKEAIDPSKLQLMKEHVCDNLAWCLEALDKNPAALGKEILRMDEDTTIMLIKQNPDKGSEWARLARDGKQVAQIVLTKHKGEAMRPWKYLGVVVEYEITWYLKG